MKYDEEYRTCCIKNTTEKVTSPTKFERVQSAKSGVFSISQMMKQRSVTESVPYLFNKKESLSPTKLQNEIDVEFA